MDAKEYLIDRFPHMEEEWDKTAHDDVFMALMMENYHQYKLKEIQQVKNTVALGDVSGCYSIEDVKQAVNFWSMTDVEEKYIKAFLNNRQ